MRSHMLAIPVVAALSSFLDFPECPGLIRKPEPRHEPWNVKWAEQLAREVREADAGEVGLLLHLLVAKSEGLPRQAKGGSLQEALKT